LTRYLLDTNVISDITKPDPSESLLEWMDAQPDTDLWFAGPEGPQSLFKGRILSFDEKAALLWARLMSEGRAAGKPRSELDMIVAAVAVANDCVIVTDNEKHFSGLEVLNPMRTLQ
jgi:predicted nucleic acid-binding protein